MPNSRITFCDIYGLPRAKKICNVSKDFISHNATVLYVASIYESINERPVYHSFRIPYEILWHVWLQMCEVILQRGKTFMWDYARVLVDKRSLRIWSHKRNFYSAPCETVLKQFRIFIMSRKRPSSGSVYIRRAMQYHITLSELESVTHIIRLAQYGKYPERCEVVFAHEPCLFICDLFSETKRSLDF